MQRATLLIVVLALMPLSTLTGQEPSHQKSEIIALSLSISGTVLPMVAAWQIFAPTADEATADRTVPVILALSGLTIGPSLGYFYVGRRGGVFLRLGVGLATTALVVSLLQSDGGGSCGVPGCVDIGSAGGAAIIGLMGAVVVVGSAIYDIATVPSSVRGHNGAAARRRLSVAPSYSLGTGAVGLNVRITF